MTATTSTLTQLASGLAARNIQIHDLTNTLSESTPTLQLPEPFANLDDFSLQNVAQFDDAGPFWAHNNFSQGEHVGTHIDAPIHWITGKDGKDVASIEPERLIGPAVVLDFTAETAQDPDFLVEVEHIQAWEAQHGPIPENGWLLFRTGWDQYSHDQAAFINADEHGSHTPGFSAECARWLAQDTKISGIGVETVGIDQGNAAELEPPFPIHYYLLGHDKYGITSLQNLAKLPTRGAIIIISPLPIVNGTAAPCRVFALVEQ